MGVFRDKFRDKLGLDIIVYTNQDAIDSGIHPIESGSVKYNEQLKILALKRALDEYKFDAALGGARRDGENLGSKSEYFQ